LSDPDARALVRTYHDQTKHHFNRFARSLGYLDWATQPDPFRRFAGTDVVDLVPSLTGGPGSEAAAPPSGGPGWAHLAFDDLFAPSPTPRVEPGLCAVSILLRYSLGLSAWKQAGPSRWALRVNPSSGNLHPVEAYVAAGPEVAGRSGVFHYAPDVHALERRAALDDGAWADAVAGLPPGTFLVGLTAIHWREAWKYGERAFRYCQHDTGHAIAALRYAAAMMGWDLRLARGWSSAALASLLGLDRDDDFTGAEREEPACLLVGSPAPMPPGVSPDASLAGRVRDAEWTGRANRLSPDRVQWDAIDRAADASRVPERQVLESDAPHASMSPHATGEHAAPPERRPGPAAEPSAARLVLRRRSAQRMDGRSSIDRARLLFMLRRLLPAAGVPFDALDAEPRVHLVLFVHRVDGLDPGLYALARSSRGRDALREALHADFLWARPEGVPADVPLDLLAPLDVKAAARQLSCAQDIAADGCVSLAMLAEFDAALDARGASAYRELFWEAGAIGQALYLEAEAAGMRGTGIGCYFDDAVHDVLGIADHRLQSLYHFTVGMPVEDQRLRTDPGYIWEKGPGPSVS